MLGDAADSKRKSLDSLLAHCYPLIKLAHLLDQTTRFVLATVLQAFNQRPFIVFVDISSGIVVL